jgi:alpha-L-fucosidase
MNKLLIIVILVGGIILTSCQRRMDNLSFKNSFELITEDNILKDSDYHNWGSSIIKGDDGKYHLFYSRWPGAFAAWLTFSEIAHATSDSPNGPWKYKETVLEGRGKGHWDAITAHNPKIKYFDGRYYLYYIATNLGDLSYNDQDLFDTHGKSLDQSPIRKMLRENQRTGVAFSSSLSGPWLRLDKPIIEPSGPITTLTVNPAIDKGKDGKYYLIVKGDKPNEERFIRNQAIAISDSPIGPFVMQPKPVIDYIDTEDMSLWYDKKRDLFYGIFHAHTYLGLICSTDGVNWERANDFEVLKKEIPMKNGKSIKPDRMERPFIYIENGEPLTLCLAILEGNRSYMVFVPIITDK